MNLENRQGSTLISVFIIFTVLIIFGTFLMSFMVNENKMSLHHQYKTQAYYIARSGAEAVEASILKMDEEEKERLLEAIERDTIQVELKDLNFDYGTVKEVLIKKEENHIVILAKGKVGNVEETVEKALAYEMQEGSSGLSEIKTAVHSEGLINVYSGLIRGDVTSNQGPISLRPYNGRIEEGESKVLNSPNEYGLPTFPANNVINFPEFPRYNPAIPIVNGKSEITGSALISADGQYTKISNYSGQNITIGSNGSDLNIWVEHLDIGGSITIIGNRTVNLHVKSSLNLNNSTPIHMDGSSKLNIYYSGMASAYSTRVLVPANIYLNPSDNNGISINDTKIIGNLYIYKGSITLTGSSDRGIEGDIYSKKGNINIPNGKVKGNIYAEDGNITVDGSANTTGYIYSAKGNITVGGSGRTDGNIFAKNGDIDISGSGRLVGGSIYLEKGNIAFKGSGSLNGNIISSGSDNRIDFGGGGSVINGFVYAPQSHVEFTSSSKLYGAVIAKTIEMHNWSALIEYQKSNINLDGIQLPGTAPSIELKSSYFK